MFLAWGSGLVCARTDGGGQPQALTESKAIQLPWSFTPDGKRLAYCEAAGSRQIWTVPVEDQGGQLKVGSAERAIESRFNDRHPSFSPDGRWLAYSSDESGRVEVYVQSFPSPSPASGGRWQISTDGGALPRWSRSSQELVYEAGTHFMAARYAVNGDTFVAEKPRVWIADLGAAESPTGGPMWDLAPDGARVAVLTPVDAGEQLAPDHEVVFLQNVFDELRRRVPITR